MDIRNFFGSKGGTKAAPAKSDSNKATGGEKKKKRAVISDSESDEEVEKKPKVETKKATPKKEADKAAKLKEINKSDFFNSKSSTSQPVKRKSDDKERKRWVIIMKFKFLGFVYELGSLD